MTRDEVMAMTDEELQAKAAELMGVKKLRGFLLPDYTNDMSAAWTLVEKLKYPNSVWYATVSLVDHTTNYLCSVIYENAEGGIFQVWDNPAPRAITRAFIMAMGSRYATSK